MKESLREQRSHARRRQRGENGNGVDEALVQDAEHDVYRHESSKNEKDLVSPNGRVRRSRALEAAVDAGGHIEPLFGFVDRSNGLAQ